MIREAKKLISYSIIHNGSNTLHAKNGIKTLLLGSVYNFDMMDIMASNKLTNQHVRFRSKKFTRVPYKLYEFGEPFPKPGQEKKLIKADPQKDQNKKEQEATTALFKLMGDIINNKSRKNIAVEGIRLIEDACLAGFKPKYIFLQKMVLKEVPAKINSLIDDQVEIHKVGQSLMQNWSGLVSPPGILAIFPKPTPEDVIRNLMDQKEKVEGHLVGTKTFSLIPICLNLREPGNLGSILRSAAGVGCRRVLVTKGCVDPWEIKVLRGGSGAHFHLEVASDTTLQSIPNFIDFSSQEIENQESRKSIGIFLADSTTNPPASGANENDNSTPLAVPYFNIDYTQFDEIFLVLGGETEGLGNDTLEIINGVKNSLDSLSSISGTTISRVNIPLQNNVESLNVANAFGIISYEIKRQFTIQNQKKKT